MFTHNINKQPVIQNASCAERSMRKVHARVRDPPEGRTIELAGTPQSPPQTEHAFCFWCADLKGVPLPTTSGIWMTRFLGEVRGQ